MSLIDHYSDYKWIKVKRCAGYNADISCDDNYKNLSCHHEKETTFLINEIKKLAAMVDERDKKIRELNKNQKETWPPEEWAPH